MKNGDKLAYPIEFSGFGQYAPEAHGGLTKREEFAARAMQALIPIYWDDVKDGTSNYTTAEEAIKCMMESACEHADALLKELEK